MVALVIVLGAVIGGIIAIFGTLVVRRELVIRPPKALDPEYRHHEVVTCGELMGRGMKAGSVGAGAGAVLGFLVYQIAF